MRSVLSTAYFPPVEYFYFLSRCEKVWIDGYENYQKQTYRNRCIIYSPNGRQSLIIPVIKPFKPKTIVKDILISYDEEWEKVHLRSIATAYNSSPFFLYYNDDLHKIIEKKHKYLFDLNNELLIKLIDITGVDTSLNYTEAYVEKPEFSDLRNSITPKRKRETEFPDFNPAPYIQVFNEKHGFIPNLSIIDLLFNEGPATLAYLERSSH